MSKEKKRRRINVCARVDLDVKEELELRAAGRNVSLGAVCREILEAEVRGDAPRYPRAELIDESQSELLRVTYFIELCQLDDLRDAYPNDWQERAQRLSTLARRAQRQTLNGDGPPDLINELAGRRRRRKQTADGDNKSAARQPKPTAKRPTPARPRLKPEPAPTKSRTPSEARLAELRNALLPKKYRD